MSDSVKEFADVVERLAARPCGYCHSKPCKDDCPQSPKGMVKKFRSQLAHQLLELDRDEFPLSMTLDGVIAKLLDSA